VFCHDVVCCGRCITKLYAKVTRSSTIKRRCQGSKRK
jgi:hypothetical protein